MSDRARDMTTSQVALPAATPEGKRLEDVPGVAAPAADPWT
jgi:hypothetical protein